MKLLTILGARPQFIKAAALSRALREAPSIREIIVHTGQHFDPSMSDIFFEEMNIPRPHYWLNVNNLSHGAMTGRMLEKVEEVILKEKPAYALVYGDTNSTLAGALAAKKLQVKVIHVEAGLRSFNMRMPEEINRILTDRISDVLYCPSSQAVKNLEAEGFKSFPCTVVQPGDVMEDAAMYYSALAASKSNILQTLNLQGQKFLLCTLHRAENTDAPERLTHILEALNELSEGYRIVLPLHPRTQKTFENKALPKLNFSPIAPVGYFDMMTLLKNTHCVLTDSGGLQKEAYFFNKYCVTLRDETEWVELVEHGFNVLTGASKTSILESVARFSDKSLVKREDFFGGGKATQRIVEHLLSLT